MLANVIAGVLQPQAGEVSLGGVPLRRLQPDVLAQHRVLIPREVYVFAGRCTRTSPICIRTRVGRTSTGRKPGTRLPPTAGRLHEWFEN